MPTQAPILYAVPFACSMAPHLVLTQHGIEFDLRWVRRGPGRRIDDEDYARLNPKRRVPALGLPSGELLTESVAILAHLDELHAPDRTPVQRRRLLEWLTFTATELHQSVLGLAFDPEAPVQAVEDARARLLEPALAHLATALSQGETLLGTKAPSAADAFALWALLLVRYRWPEALVAPSLLAYVRRLSSLDFVRTVMAIEQDARETESSAQG